MFNVGQDINSHQLLKAIDFCVENGNFLRILGDTGFYRICSPESLTEEEKIASVKMVRNLYLKETDFTQTNDAPFTEEEKGNYASYRVYLRDFPESESFPNIYPVSYENWI